MPTVYLLRIEIGHLTRYVATEAVAPVDDEGHVLAHAPTLDDPGYREALDWLRGTGGISGASVRFAVPDLDLPYLAAHGYHPWAARAELSRWTVGTSYGERVPVAAGRLALDTLPAKGLPISAEIVAEDYVGVFPPAGWTSDALDAPHAADDPTTYPFVWGRAGAYLDDENALVTTRASVVRAVGYDVSASVARKVLVCGGIATTSQVQLYSAADDDFQTGTCATGYDLAGQPLTYCDITGLAFAAWTKTSAMEVYVTDYPDGGHVSRDGVTPIQSLGELALHLLQTAGYPIDTGAWSAVVERLRTYQTAGAIDEPVEPVAWIAENIGALLPAFYLLNGPRGLAPVLLHTDPPPDAYHLEDGVNCHLSGDGQIRVLPSDRLVSYSLRFALRIRTGRYRARVTASAARPLLYSGETSLRTSAVQSEHALRAQSLGYAGADADESDILYDRATATTVAREQLRWRHDDARSLTLAMDDREADHEALAIGAPVRVTVASRYLSEQEAHIIAREVSAGVLYLTVVWL